MSVATIKSYAAGEEKAFLYDIVRMELFWIPYASRHSIAVHIIIQKYAQQDRQSSQEVSAKAGYTLKLLMVLNEEGT